MFMGQNNDDGARLPAADEGKLSLPSVLAPGPARHLFSTQGLPATSRLELWEQHNAQALLPLDIRTIDESPLLAQEINLRHGELRFAGVTGSSQVVERNEAFIKKNPTDAIAIFFTLEQEAFFFHRGGNEFLKPGQAVIHDADSPFMRGFGRGLKEMVLTIPREKYLKLNGGKPLLGPRVVEFGGSSGSNPQLRALAKLVSDTISARDLAQVPDGPLNPETAVMEMLGHFLMGEERSSSAGYLLAAYSFIDDHLGEPDLGIAEVSLALGLSERHLSRIFREAGEPPGGYIRVRRLEVAKELLSNPAHGLLQVGQVATRVGFISQSYFTRAFKAHYGTTPLQLRKDALRRAAG